MPTADDFSQFVGINPQWDNNTAATSDPTVDDDNVHGYGGGSYWFHGNAVFMCVDGTNGAAVWVRVSL